MRERERENISSKRKVTLSITTHLLSQVICRIFYIVDRNWNGRITTSELRRSNFLQVLALLEDEPDINQITDYFSYEHFYVIYCKFWELDTDHDLIIDAQDLSRHEDHGGWSKKHLWVELSVVFKEQNSVVKVHVNRS